MIEIFIIGYLFCLLSFCIQFMIYPYDEVKRDCLIIAPDLRNEPPPTPNEMTIILLFLALAWIIVLPLMVLSILVSLVDGGP